MLHLFCSFTFPAEFDILSEEPQDGEERRNGPARGHLVEQLIPIIRTLRARTRASRRMRKDLYVPIDDADEAFLIIRIE